MAQREVYILIAAAVLIGGAVTIGLLASRSMQGVLPGEGLGEGGEVVAEEPTGFTEEVPQKAEETAPEEVIQVVTDPERNESLGVYTVVATRSGYSPSQLVVTEGNIVRLQFRADGGAYDIFIPAMNVYLSAEADEEVLTSFRVPQSGTFTFGCRDFCPWGKEISGELVVKPR